MTFYELEKECKKRKNRQLVIVFLSVFVLMILIIAGYYFYKDTKKVKPIKKTEVKKTEIKKVVKEDKNITKKAKPKKSVIKQLQTLSPIIELNFTEINSNIKLKEIKKQKKVTEINKTKPISKNKILSINNLPSYDTCIKLAKKFYLLKDYDNALKWAKNANLQNKSLPESWILTAKSLYKLNKKSEALKILKIYYKYTKNKKILKLINRIQNDKI